MQNALQITTTCIMKSLIKKTDSVFYIKALEDLNQAELVIRTVKGSISNAIEISVLGKMDADAFNNKKRLVNKRRTLKAYWRSLFGKETDIGFFFHPEIGNVYIIGPLAPMFLYDISGKKLGALSGGTYGILRGFGIGPKDTMNFLDSLDKGSCLLIFKGDAKQIKQLEVLIRQLGKTA